MNILIAEKNTSSHDIILQKSKAYFGKQHIFKLSSNLIEAKRFLKEQEINFLVAELQTAANRSAQKHEQKRINTPLLTAIQVIEGDAFEASSKNSFVDNQNIILIKKPFNKAEINLALQNLFTPQKQKQAKVSRFMLPVEGGIRFVKLVDIIRVEASGSYSVFYLRDGSSIMASKRLKIYESMLPSDCFIRVHNSHLVNILYLKKYIKNGGLHLVLENNSKVPVSSSKKPHLESAFKAFCGSY
jgi:hypothetical protein